MAGGVKFPRGKAAAPALFSGPCRPALAAVTTSQHSCSAALVTPVRQAVRHGIARALQNWDPKLRPLLKTEGERRLQLVLQQAALLCFALSGGAADAMWPGPLLVLQSASEFLQPCHAAPPPARSSRTKSGQLKHLPGVRPSTLQACWRVTRALWSARSRA